MARPSDGGGVSRRNDEALMRRQRYRLKATVEITSFRACPEWVDHEGVYEGDIDPSSQDCPDLRIRLCHPRDPDLTFLVVETVLDEVD